MTEDVKNQEQPKNKAPLAPALHLASLLINDEKLRSSIKGLLPPGEVKLEQFCSSLSNYLFQKVKPLEGASYEDLRNCAFEAAQAGLLIGGSFTHADIIVRSKVAKLEIGKHGIRYLAFRSGLIKSIEGTIVYEGETFRCNWGDPKAPIYHEADLLNSSDKILGVYVLTIYTNDVIKAHVMGLPKMLAYQEEAKKKASPNQWPYSPWNRFLPEMCIKTLLKRACKQIPFRPSSASAYAFELLNSGFDEREEVEKKKPEAEPVPVIKPTKDALDFIDDVIDDVIDENGEVLEGERNDV